jgi:uncharacterized protein YbaR (Trm112 family)
MDNRLLELLVCPVCRGPLQLHRDERMRPHELHCPADRLAFPIRDGLPCMLESEARHLGGAQPTADTARP